VGYYKGDPGFFSSVFSGVKGLLGLGTSMIPGVGGAISKVVSRIPTQIRAPLAKVGSGIIKHPVLSAAGGAAGISLLGAGEAGRAGLLGRPAGKHPSARHLRALAMGLRRAKPRMNPTNVHALRRAIRRTHGFARLAMKVIHITHPKKKGRFGGFRKKRKR
jgi:hypothetical protein